MNKNEKILNIIKLQLLFLPSMEIWFKKQKSKYVGNDKFIFIFGLQTFNIILKLIFIFVTYNSSISNLK